MKQFVASSDRVEVNGETVFSIIDGLGVFRLNGIKILESHGIADIQKGKWYNQQKWLDSFKEISLKLGESSLFAIGLKIPENAKFPPGIKDVHDALNSLDAAYHMNHRGGEIGNYIYTKLSETSGIMLCTNPYPDFFDRGIITAIIRRFNRTNSFVRVNIDASKPQRGKGGISTSYNIFW